MQSAGVGPFFIHGAAACFGVQVVAITAGASGQGEDAVFKIEAFDQPRLLQAFANLLGLFVFGLKWIDQAKAHQIGQLYFDRHGAAVGRTSAAQAAAVAGPSVGVVHIDDGDVRPHALLSNASDTGTCKDGI